MAVVRLLLPCLLALAALPAMAQFAMVPQPKADLPPPVASAAATPVAYKRDAARHVYDRYPGIIYKGVLPPLLYGIAIVETLVDEQGQVVDVTIRRPPAAKEVGPWVVSLIKNAGPYPAPSTGAPMRFSEIWLVHKSGRFQLDTLTEGQR